MGLQHIHFRLLPIGVPKIKCLGGGKEGAEEGLLLTPEWGAEMKKGKRA